MKQKRMRRLMVALLSSVLFISSPVFVFVNQNGLLELNNTYDGLEFTTYVEIIDMIKLCNQSIADGILHVDPKTTLLSNTIN